MRWLLVTLMLFGAMQAHADERRLNGEEIATLLVDIVAVSDTTRQTFDKDGNTDFDDGRHPTVGRWRVQNESYCSQWPPSRSWRCYHLFLNERAEGQPDLIIWVDAELGDRTINTILRREQ